MEKIAILTRGSPYIIDNNYRYSRAFNNDINIMTSLLLNENYSVIEVPLNDLIRNGENLPKSEFLLFYYTGHGNFNFNGFSVNDILNYIDKLAEEKIIIFDSCLGKTSLDDIEIPRKSKLFAAGEAPLNKSIAKILWDLIIARKKGSVESLNQDSFNEIKQNWIYFKERN